MTIVQYQQLSIDVFPPDKDGIQWVKTNGVDFGRNISLEVHKESMDVFNVDDGYLVLHVPGQNYWSARWSQGYMPAHYMVVRFGECEEVGKTTPPTYRYRDIQIVAEIPLRRGAKQK